MFAVRLQFFDYSEPSAKDKRKTASKKAVYKIAEVTGDLICIKIFNKTTKT